MAVLSESWKKRYPGVVKYWRENLHHLTVFMKYPESVRSYICTANQLRRIIKEIRRRTKTIEIFSSEDSLVSVRYLILKFEDEKLGGRRLEGFSSVKSGEEGRVQGHKFLDTIHNINTNRGREESFNLGLAHALWAALRVRKPSWWCLL